MNKPQKQEGFQPDAPVVDAVEDKATLPSPPVVLDEWPIKVKLLHKSIRNTKGEMIKELVFREPSGGDINRYGNPVRVDQYGEVVIDEKKMSMMMSSLAGVLLPMFEQIDPRDWNSCAYRLRGFFLPEPAAWD